MGAGFGYKQAVDKMDVADTDKGETETPIAINTAGPDLWFLNHTYTHHLVFGYANDTKGMCPKRSRISSERSSSPGCT